MTQGVNSFKYYNDHRQIEKKKSDNRVHEHDIYKDYTHLFHGRIQDLVKEEAHKYCLSKKKKGGGGHHLQREGAAQGTFCVKRVDLLLVPPLPPPRFAPGLSLPCMYS